MAKCAFLSKHHRLHQVTCWRFTHHQAHTRMILTSTVNCFFPQIFLLLNFQLPAKVHLWNLSSNCRTALYKRDASTEDSENVREHELKRVSLKKRFYFPEERQCSHKWTALSFHTHLSWVCLLSSMENIKLQLFQLLLYEHEQTERDLVTFRAALAGLKALLCSPVGLHVNVAKVTLFVLHLWFSLFFSIHFCY